MSICDQPSDAVATQTCGGANFDIPAVAPPQANELPPPDSALRVTTQVNGQDLFEIQQLRYRIYCDQQLRRPVGADHLMRCVGDYLDASGSHLLAAQGDAVLAAARMHELRSSGFPMSLRESLRAHLFQQWPAQGLVYLSRIVVQACAEAPSLRRALMCGAYRAAREQGRHFLFLSSPPRQLRLYRSYGFQVYAEGFRDPRGTYKLPMAMALDDVTQLARMESPFCHIAHKFDNTGEAGEWFARLVDAFANELRAYDRSSDAHSGGDYVSSFSAAEALIDAPAVTQDSVDLQTDP